MAQPRRFPPPWTIEELDACFVVIDSAEQKLAYVYFEEERGRAKLLTKMKFAGLQRSGPDDVRNGSIRKNGSILAVFSGLLVVQDENQPLLSTPRFGPSEQSQLSMIVLSGGAEGSDLLVSA